MVTIHLFYLTKKNHIIDNPFSPFTTSVSLFKNCTQACFGLRTAVLLNWIVYVVKSQLAACLWIYMQGNASGM